MADKKCEITAGRFSVSTAVYTIIMSVCLQAVRGLLDNPNEPVNELSYFDCIESVMENSKVRALKIIA